MTTLLFIITGFLIVNSSLHGPVIFGQQQEKNQHYSFVSKWDSEGSGDGQLSRPHSIDIDSNSGHVYVADSGNNRVQKFTTDKEGANVQKFSNNGMFVTRWGSEGNEDGQFADPEDIAVDSKTGNVYITDTGNSRIQVFSIAHL